MIQDVETCISIDRSIINVIITVNIIMKMPVPSGSMMSNVNTEKVLAVHILGNSNLVMFVK